MPKGEGLTKRNKERAIHGMEGTPTYITWRSIKSRCLNKNFKDYKNYGAKGIKICERWMTFKNFLEDMGIRPLGTQIDRINNKMGYELKNCRWVTPMQNANNKTNNFNLMFRGKSQSVSMWARETGIEKNTLRNRIKAGWDIDLALSIKPHHGNAWFLGTRKKIRRHA